MKSIVTILRTQFDLLAGIGALAIIFLTSYVEELHILQRVLLLPSLLLCPGVLFLAAVYPQRDDLGRLERVVASVSVSLALTTLMGLALNETSLGIGSRSFTALLFGCGFCCAAIAFYRREKPTRQSAAIIQNTRPLGLESNIQRAMTSIFSFLLLLLLAVFYYLVFFPGEQGHVSTTQFYVESVSTDLQAYPDSRQLPTVRLGLVNMERKPMRYEIWQQTDGQVGVHIADFEVDAHGEWQRLISLPEDTSGRRIFFHLYSHDYGDQPYRTLYLLLR